MAARRAVNAGIVVVAAAGNNGKNAQGITSYAGVTAPGNAPWVLTVGASSHMGSSRSLGRRDCRLQLARTGSHRLRSETGHRRARRRHRVPGDARQPAVYNRWPRTCSKARFRRPVSALSEPERHEHVGAGRGWHRRADAAGQPVAHAQCRESDPAIHRGTEHEATTV